MSGCSVATMSCFFGRSGSGAVPIGDDSGEAGVAQPPEPQGAVQGTPVIALLDGMPLTGHVLLDGRLVVDDPDGYEDAYQAAERSHGTAMASLICHDDLDVGGRRSRSRFTSADHATAPLVRWPLRRGGAGGCSTGGPGPPGSGSAVRRRRWGAACVARCSRGEPVDRRSSACVREGDERLGAIARLAVVEVRRPVRRERWESCPGDLAGRVDTRRWGASLEERERLVISAVAKDTRNRRLLSPAETLNGLTVGAVHVDGSGPGPNRLVDPVGVGMPNVVSAHGPGYRRAIKPEIQLPGGRQMLTEDPAPPVGTTVSAAGYVVA